MVTPNELPLTAALNRAARMLGTHGGSSLGAVAPDQGQPRYIKSQQASMSRDREKMIQGIQYRTRPDQEITGHAAALYDVLNGFGEQDSDLTETDLEHLPRGAAPSASVNFGPATSFAEAGRRLAESFTLNRKQGIAEQLCKLRGCAGDFGGIPIVLSCQQLHGVR